MHYFQYPIPIVEPIEIFNAYDSDPHLEKTMNALCPVEKSIKLRVGAQVMLAKNLDVEKGLVNGARGVVTGFEKDMKGAKILSIFHIRKWMKYYLFI